MALPPSFRRVIVDDASPLIQYTSSWNQIPSASRDTLNSGPAFDGTLHWTKSTSSFSLNFTGSDVVVYSSVDPIVVNGTVQPDPQWECIVDGNSLGLDQIDQADNTPQNNIDICHAILSDGPHELTVRVSSKGNPFYLDAVQYTPSADADLSNTVMKVYNSDPNIKVSADFQRGTYGVYQTQKAGGTVSFDFVGTSVDWVGYIFSGFANQSATATWSVDGSAPVSFALPTSDISYGNTVFFTTHNVTLGAHKLLVTYEGNSKAMPLVLDYFFLHNESTTPAASANGTAASTTTTSQASTSASSGASESTTSPPTIGRSTMHNTARTGVIAGAVAGSVLFLILVTTVLVMYKRNRRLAARANEKNKSFEQDGSDSI